MWILLDYVPVCPVTQTLSVLHSFTWIHVGSMSFSISIRFIIIILIIMIIKIIILWVFVLIFLVVIFVVVAVVITVALLKLTATAVLQHLLPSPGRDVLILNQKKKKKRYYIADSLGPAQSSCEKTNASLKAEGDFNSDNPSHPRIFYLPRPLSYTINNTRRIACTGRTLSQKIMFISTFSHSLCSSTALCGSGSGLKL